jgi:hypothetical protein
MSQANRVRLEEQASNGLTRREINADLMGRDIDFDPTADIETLLMLRQTSRVYESRDT